MGGNLRRPSRDGGPARAPGGRRRLLVWLGLVGLALALLVVLPATLGSRPAFLERYSGVQEAHEDWSGSLHSGVRCQRCHIEPGLLPQSAYSARMAGEFYLSLVTSREPDLLGRPSNDACLGCHMDLRTVSPSGDLLIPHRAHVEMLEMECVDCHDYSLHESTPASPRTPPMAGCLTCHDGVAAKDECSACHTDKDPPPTHFEDEWLVAHADHAEDDECASCHEWTEQWCADCHAIRPESHGDDWRAEHRDRVAEHRNCEACHEGSFCVRCHGVVPLLNFDPTLMRVE